MNPHKIIMGEVKGQGVLEVPHLQAVKVKISLDRAMGVPS